MHKQQKTNISYLNESTLSLKTGFKRCFTKARVQRPFNHVRGLLASTEMHAPAPLLFNITHCLFNLQCEVQASLSMLSFTCIAEVIRRQQLKLTARLGFGEVQYFQAEDCQ